MSQMETTALCPFDFPASKTSQLPSLLCPHRLKGCCLPSLRLQCPQVKAQTRWVCKPKGPIPVSAIPASSSLFHPVSRLWDPLVRGTLAGHQVRIRRGLQGHLVQCLTEEKLRPRELKRLNQSQPTPLCKGLEIRF